MLTRFFNLFILIFLSSLVCCSLLDKRQPQAWDSLRCERDEVACLDQRRCIPKARVCDDNQDCIDNSDEMECENSCRGDAFRCNNGKCIPRKWVCDSFDDCGDSSDEVNYCLGLERLPCTADAYRCEDGPCIPLSQICDGKSNCPQNDDENRCDQSTDPFKEPNLTPREGTLNDVRRSEWYFRPENSMSLRYPDTVHPRSSSLTYQRNNEGHRSLNHHANGKSLTSPKKLDSIAPISELSRLNREPLHSVSSDLDNVKIPSTELFCADTEFKCSDNLRCIPRKSRCDHRFDCVDQSDEKNCIIDPCVYGLFRCHDGKCAISSWRCNATDWTGRRVTVMTSDFEAFL